LWPARAGIAGYVTQDDTLQVLVQRIHDATVGEFACPPRVAATLLRSLAVSTIVDGRQRAAARLTQRELEIVQLIERGLSNKEIARHLTIQLATVKSHVHNILEKLGVRHRNDAVRAALSSESQSGGRWDRFSLDPSLGYRDLPNRDIPTVGEAKALDMKS
jgi:two-component system nitrate/nitrite response regulator NarL